MVASDGPDDIFSGRHPFELDAQILELLPRGIVPAERKHAPARVDSKERRARLQLHANPISISPLSSEIY